MHGSIVGSSKCVYDAAPDTSPPPTDEAVVACGVRSKHLGQITPRCSRAQDPEDAIEDTTVVNPRNATRLVRQHGLYGNPFIIGKFVALDSSSRFGSLNHGSLADSNAPSPILLVRRSRAKADIHHVTVPAETVENDPGCVKTPCCCYDSLVILRGKLMRRFVEQADRGQCTLLPECLDDFIDESNPVRVIDVFVDALDLVEMSFEGGNRRQLVGRRTILQFSSSFISTAI